MRQITLPRPTRGTAALSLVAALTLAGCGGGDADPLASGSSSPDEQVADRADAADPSSWLGLERSEAEAFAAGAGVELRVAREDDMVFPLTDDLSPGRVTVEYDYRGAAEPIVTVATVETEDGPRTARADDTGPDNMVDDGSLTGPGDAPDDPNDPAVSGPADEGPAPTDDGGHDERSPQEVAASYLGLTEQEAMQQAAQEDRTMRVGRRGDEQYMLTEDYRIGRITVDLDRSGEDWVVVEVVLEAEDGPVTASED